LTLRENSFHASRKGGKKGPTRRNSKKNMGVRKRAGTLTLIGKRPKMAKKKGFDSSQRKDAGSQGVGRYSGEGSGGGWVWNTRSG